MRKSLVILLALPVYATIYASIALQRWVVARLGVALGVGAFLAFGVMALARPAATTATRPTEIVPLPRAAFASAVTTDVALGAPMTITFTTPMSADSVASSLKVDPTTPVRLTWDATRTHLTIAPSSHWQAGTYHTITVEPGALAASGRPLTTPARAAFLTRAAASAVLTATDVVGRRIATDTSFTITFDHAVDPASVEHAFRIVPATAGTVVAEPAGQDGTVFTFRPAKALKPGTRYQVVVEGVRDTDGLAIAGSTLVLRTVASPTVVRFRPLDGTATVDRGAAISVRFTQPMQRASTKAAFKVVADGKVIAGKVSFAEGDTVLVFEPKAALPWGATIVATVATSARSTDGVALSAAGKATFETVAKAAPKPKAKPAPKPKPIPKPPSGGSVGSGSWGAVERYYLRLMNCTRTGGWVTSSGSCSSPGGRSVAALRLSSGISSKVSRPYARMLARSGQCSHFIGGNPGDRLRRAGYTSYRWAENLGCRSGNPYGAVLGSHRFFQSERPYLGGHYVNLMNAKYDQVGIGVWVASGRVRLVVDFYHP